VLAVSLRLSKPRALGGQSMPSLQVHRRADEMHYAQERKGFGEVDVIHEGAGYGIYRLRVRAGGTIPTHVHQVMEESELVLGAGLQLQGAPVRRGSAFRWPHGLPHRYDNPSSTEQTILCVDRPPFIPGDEVEVEAPPTGLSPVASTSYYVHEDAARPEGHS
jgi:mannose-6-phosphate isomerase-like protein (cupin superfamily)